LIASGANVAFGAPCFFTAAGGCNPADGGGEICGGVLGDGVSLGVADLDGVSLSSGLGEDFLIRRGDELGGAAAVVFFFSVDGVIEGAGDSLAGTGEDFFFGEPLVGGKGLFGSRFFFRGVGVGVGVEKIFLIVSPSDGSAAGAGTTAETAKAMARKTRTSITKAWTDCGADFLKVDFGVCRRRDAKCNPRLR